MHLLLVAARFLTRLPLPDVDVRGGDLAAATGLFPVVGLVVATVASAGWFVGAVVAGPTVAAVLAVTGGVVVTGAFHDDGLADVADGWFGGFDRARRLEIMRDSRVGTFGAAALALSLLLRVALLAAPWTAGSVDAGGGVPFDPVAAVGRAWVLLAAGHVVGRAGILVARWAAPVADAGSLSRLVAPSAGAGRLTTVVGVVVAVLVAVLAAGPWAPAVLAAVASAAIGTARWSTAKVGGLTGDALGATAVVGEVVALAAVVAVLRHA